MDYEEMATMVRAELARISGNVSAGLDANKTRVAELNARLLDLEQKAARSRDGGGGGGFDFGGAAALQAAFDAATGLADLRERRQGAKASIDLPPGYFAPRSAVIGLAPGQVDRVTTIVGMPMQRLTIRDLLPRVQTSAASIAYVQESSFANNAAPVSEGSLKPESLLALALKTAPIVTLAHFVKASTQILDDFSGLSSFIDLKMRHGLSLVEEAQLLNGSGIGNNLSGLRQFAPVFTDGTAGATRADTLRRAIGALEVAQFSPSGIVLHPTDWAEIELTKSVGSGEYAIATPRTATPPVLWGLPVVTSISIPLGAWLVGDFLQAATLFDRWLARVDIASENTDDFIRNMVTIRAEERLALATHTPDALRKGTFA